MTACSGYLFDPLSCWARLALLAFALIGGGGGLAYWMWRDWK